MRKYRLIAVGTLLVLPSIFVSSTGYSASQLPGINPAGPIQQQNCPTGRQNGCFNLSFQQTGGNGAINTGFAKTASYQYTPLNSCLQLMQMFLRLGVRPS